MKVGIMQPYFFPYIGYFELIFRTDLWIVFDTAQYIRHGWVNRNRILHPKQGWQYILVPVQKHKQKTPIKDILIVDGIPWRERIVGQLQHYKRKAPFSEQVISLVSDCLDYGGSSLSRLNVRCLEKVCAYLGIPFRPVFFSEMNLALGPIEGPGDWALRIAEAVGAEEYINPPGGAHLFDRSKFESAGVKLTIQPPMDFVYECRGYTFEPNLSILDVLMWNPPEKVLKFFHSRVADW